MEDGAAGYGAAGFGEVKRDLLAAKKGVGLGMIVSCVLVPVLIFLVTFWAMSFSLRYSSASAAYGVAFLALVCCMVMGFMTIQAARGKGGDFHWLGLLCALSLIGWAWGFFGGNANYSSNAAPYFDLNALNVYESVDPTTSRGNQYMDAGIIGFEDTAVVNRSYAMSFKDDDVYCVAPITVQNATPAVYDFWAVGKNCCNQHLFNFMCGEYNNPYAHTGVRLMNPNEEQLFQIVVKQAQAAYSLPTSHPMMFQWVSNPADIVNSYEDEAYKSFIHEAIYWLIIDIVLVVVAAVVFSKI